jgi:hypothetical protein
MPKITFNGKVYNDLAEMPAVERQAYEQLMGHFKDENQDGIPDIFQGDVVSNIVSAIASTDFVVDGKRVGGFKNLTQEQRLKLERGMGMLQKMGIIKEMPNLDGGIHAPHPTAMPVWDDKDRPGTKEEESYEEKLPNWLDSDIRASKPIIANKSAIQEDSVNVRILLIVIGMVILAGLGVMLFFLMGS